MNDEEEEVVIATGAVFNESESTTFSIPYVVNSTEVVWFLDTIDIKHRKAHLYKFLQFDHSFYVFSG